MTEPRAPYRPRELANRVLAALESQPVVVVTGLRQAGKTTFLQNETAFSGRRYLTLDDFATQEAAEREPEALLAGDDPITIDEIQRSPKLLLAIKRAVDRRRRPGRFLLSGSANLALLRGVSESLAGRATYFTLHPLTRREIHQRTAEMPFLVRFLAAPALSPSAGGHALAEEEILDGGMPPVVLGIPGSRDIWHLGYEQTYLQRDLRELAQLLDLISFRNLMRLAALRSGRLLNQSELGRDARLSASTTGRYLGLLETSFLVQRVPPYLRSRASRLIKTPKLYFTDSGIAAHLASVEEISPTSDEPLRGALFETYVLQNLSSLLGAHLPKAELAYWSVQGRSEVDFVVSSGRGAVAIEVKAASRFGDRDLAGLKAFAASTPGVRAGVLAYNGEEARVIGENLYAIPLGLLLS